jgi:hypothetical protein
MMKESTAKLSSGQGRTSEGARALIRRTKQASRRRFPAEEKIRMRGDSLRDATTVVATRSGRECRARRMATASLRPSPGALGHDGMRAC